MKRNRISRGKSKRQFTKGAKHVKSINRVVPQRGGIRL